MQRKPICENTLAMLYETGEPIRLIAERFDCGENTITRRARKLGLRHPLAPKEQQADLESRVSAINAIARYQNGESLNTVARALKVFPKVLSRYLRRKGVYVRSHREQIAVSMKRHGTRFYENESKLYAYTRDKMGMVTKIKVWRNDNQRAEIKEVVL